MFDYSVINQISLRLSYYAGNLNQLWSRSLSHHSDFWSLYIVSYPLYSVNRMCVTFFTRNGHVKVVRYLVDEAHCDPHVKNNDGWTPLHFACV